MLVTAGAAVAIYLVMNREVVAPAQPDATPVPPAQEAPAPAQATPPATPSEAAAATQKPASAFTLTNGERPGKVTLPDGSTIEAINDVTDDIALMWDEQPYSPIVDKVFHNGWWWWKHQDGAWTTVKMVDMNGVPQATPILAREGKGSPAQTADEAIAEREKAQQQQGARR